MYVVNTKNIFQDIFNPSEILLLDAKISYHGMSIIIKIQLTVPSLINFNLLSGLVSVMIAEYWR